LNLSYYSIFKIKFLNALVYNYEFLSYYAFSAETINHRKLLTYVNNLICNLKISKLRSSFD